MTDTRDALASSKTYEPISFAKKYRISVEDARRIIEEHGEDKKSADKAARRIRL